MSRLNKTLADYVAIAISPALIMLMVGSLMWFLVAVFYQGHYDGRIYWILACFTLAIVLIARIGIEEGQERATLFGVPLAIAVGLATMKFSSSMYLHWVLLGVAWWAAHKLTWDCTLIDEEQDSSGQGLLQFVGFGKKPPENNGNGKEASEKKKEEEPAEPEGVTDRVSRMRDEAHPKRQTKGKAHTPGVWIVYFSLAALPLFGLGQMLVPVADSATRLWTFQLLATYVAAGLGLLVTTSFLGLRRYLRQRGVQMPPQMAGVWIALGAVIIVVLLAVCAILPRPAAEYEVARMPDFPLKFTTPERESNRYAMGKEGADRNAPDSQSRTQSKQDGSKPEGGKSEDPESGGKEGSRAKEGSGEKKSSEGKSQTSSKGEQQQQSESNQDSPKQQQSGDSQQQQERQPNSQSGEKSSEQQNDSHNQSSEQGKQQQEQSGEQQDRSEQQHDGQQQQGNEQQRDGQRQQGNEQQRDGDQQQGNERRDSADNREDMERNESGDKDSEEQSRRDEETEQRDEQKRSRSANGADQSRDSQRQDEQPDREEEREEDEEQKDQDGSGSTSTSEPKPDNPPFQLPQVSFTGGLFGLLKFLIYVVLAFVAAYWLWKNWSRVVAGFRQFLQELRDLWASLFGRKPRAAEETTEDVKPKKRRERPFADYVDPFSAGMASRYTPDELVRYTFEATEAWARENGCCREPDHTPNEFATRIGRQVEALRPGATTLARLYCQAAYAPGSLAPNSVKPLADYWRRLRASHWPVAPPPPVPTPTG